MRIKKQKNNLEILSKKLGTLIIPLTCSAILTLVWFISRKELASGESGVFFYTSKNNLNYLLNSWSEVIIGTYTAYAVAIQPFLKIIVFLHENLGIPFYLQQAGLFFLILITVQISVGYIARKLFPSIQQLGLVSAQLFSVLNLGAITFIWNRFQYPFMIFYPILPLSIAFLFLAYSRGIKYIFLLNIVLFIFAFSLTSLPLLTLYWGILLFFPLYLFLSGEYSKKRILIVFLSHLVIWSILNFWWLHQFYLSFLFSPFITTTAYSQAGNLSTLESLSQRLGDMSYLIRNMHKDFYKDISSLWGWYDSIFFILLSYIPPFFVFSTILFRKKNKNHIYFLSCLLILLFLMKGTSGPFGYIFRFLYSEFRLLESFRNPVEKFSLVTPLFYAPLFGLGVQQFYGFLQKRVSKRKATFATYIILFLTLVVLVFPMWTGHVFMSMFKPQDTYQIGYKVEIPQEYESLNNYLLKEKPKRLVVLPLGPEGVTYTWKYGYSGVEQSSNLITIPVISFNNGSEYLSELIQNIQFTTVANPSKIPEILSQLGVDGIVVRSDIDWIVRGVASPQNIMNILEDVRGIRKVYQNKYFAYYEMDNPSNLFNISSNPTLISEGVTLGDVTLLSNGENSTIVNTRRDLIPVDFAKENILKSSVPQTISSSLPEVNTEEAARILPHSFFKPDSPFFFIMKAKEEIDNPGGDEELFYRLNILNKRFAELYRYVHLKDLKNAEKSLLLYEEELNEFISFIDTNEILYEQNYIYMRHIFASQNVLIQELSLENDEFAARIKKSFYAFLKKHKQLSLYEFQRDDSIGDTRTIFELVINKPSTYDLFLEKNGKEFYLLEPENITNIQIDKTIHSVTPEDEAHTIFLGSFELSEGTHEIQIPLIKDRNIIKQTVLPIESIGKKTEFIPLGRLTSFSDYQIDFTYDFSRGKDFEFQVIGSDSNDFKQYSVITRRYFTYDANTQGPQKFTQKFSSNSAHQYYGLKFVVGKSEICPGEKFLYDVFCSLGLRDRVLEKSKITVTDLYAKRILSNTLIARSQLRKEVKIDPSIAVFKRDTTRYDLRIENASSPFIISFLQRFHRGWELRFSENNIPISNQSHILINSFANGWIVNKKGSYEMSLEFTPERVLKRDKKIAELTLGIITLSMVAAFILKIKK